MYSCLFLFFVGQFQGIRNSAYNASCLYNSVTECHLLTMRCCRSGSTGSSRILTATLISSVRYEKNLNYFYRPQTKFAKVMFLHVSVCPLGRGSGGIPACLAGLQAHIGGGEVKGSGCGVSRPTPRGEVERNGWGVSRPTPRGKLRGLAGGGGSPGPHQGGVNPCMHWGRHPLSRWLLLWVVRILLECIVVITKFIKQFSLIMHFLCKVYAHVVCM